MKLFSRLAENNDNTKFNLSIDIDFYYIDTSVLLENTPLVKFIRNHIRDSSGVFSISLLVRISMLSEISRLSLRLYLNSLVYDRNISRSSSNFFGNSWQSSVIFGKLSSEIFGKCSATFVRPSHKFWKIFRNLWKVVGNLRKIVNYAIISMST